MSDFFIQGECNCKRCVEKRKLALSSKVLANIEDYFPFKPFYFDASRGFMSRGYESAEKLEAELHKVIKLNKQLAKVYPKKDQRYCCYCGIIHERDVVRMIKPDGLTRYLCQDCFDEHFFICHRCENTHSIHEVIVVGGFKYCLPCANSTFVKCRYCRRHLLPEEEVDLSEYPHLDGIYICQKCARQHIVECQGCGDMFLDQDIRWREDETPYCVECHEAMQTIKSFNYKPKPKYKTVETEGARRRDSLLLGIELEVELYGNTSEHCNRNWVGQHVIDFIGSEYVYCKHDGSLRDGGQLGFEIVTHPFSWQHYRQTMRKQWTALFELLKTFGCTSYESGRCGMHVHFNKPAFTKHHSYKFVDFVYNPAHLPFIVHVSGRGEYDQRFRTYASLDGYHDIKRFVKDGTGRGHHSAIDLAPASTNELRIFRGTLTPSLFNKNMEFCHALFHFTKQVSRARNTVPEFMAWICQRKNRGQYRDLVKYLIANKQMIQQYGLLYKLREMGV